MRAGSYQLPGSACAFDLLKLCRKMPGSAWKSLHGGSRKWLPKQRQDREGSGGSGSTMRSHVRAQFGWLGAAAITGGHLAVAFPSAW